MTHSSSSCERLVGLVRIRDHCVFTWERPQSGDRRIARVGPTHCQACIDELLRLGYPILGEAQENDKGQR